MSFLTLSPDVINASFEVFGTLLGIPSILALVKDKQVKGVSVWPSVFFVSWGFFNIFFYTTVNQPISRYAAVGMLFTNIVWFVMATYYKRKQVEV